MDKRPGRFSIDAHKTMRIGTAVYRDLVKKMLSVHIATMERKMRACVQCPPRCPELPGQDLRQNPYTRRYKKQPFLPRKLLSTYVTNRLRRAERVKKGKLTLEEEKRERRVMELKEKKLREWNGRIDKAEEAAKHRKQMVVAQIRALQRDAAKLASLGDQVDTAGERKEEYDAAIVQAREDIQTIVQGGDQDQMTIDFQSVADRVAKTGPVPDDLFKDVPEDLNELTPTVDVRTGTGQDDDVELQPLAFTDDTFDEPEEIPDADAANPELGITAFAEATIASMDADAADPAEAATMEEVPEVQVGEDGEEEPDEKSPELLSKADELAALIAGRLASPTGTDTERKKERQSWRKSPAKFWGKVKGGRWPGPGVMPKWAEDIIFANGEANRRKTFLGDLLRNRTGIDKVDAWIPIIKKQLTEQVHAWILPEEERVEDDAGPSVPPVPHFQQAGLDEYFETLPTGLTDEDAKTLDMIYKDKWRTHLKEFNANLSAADFEMEGVPLEHFIKIAQLHRKALHRAKDTGKYDEKIPPEDYQPFFYEVCVEDGGVATSDAEYVQNFEEEVFGIINVSEPMTKLMWKVPEEIRAKPGWPGGTKEELPGFFKDINHLMAPVWKNAYVEDDDEEKHPILSFAVPFHLNCSFPDISYGVRPIDIRQLRLATNEDEKKNPNVFEDDDVEEEASSYHPGSDVSSTYPVSSDYILTPSIINLADEDEPGSETEDEEESGK